MDIHLLFNAIHQFMDIYVFFYFRTFISNAALNIDIQVFMWTNHFPVLGYIPRSCITGSNGNSMFSIFEKLINYFPQGSVSFYIPINNVLHILTHTWLLSVFLVLAIPEGVKWCVL